MQRPIVFVAAALTFLVLLGLMVWQGSFSFPFAPNARETIVLGAVSTLIFLLAVTLAFMLFRAGVKAYIERQQQREGSRIRSKMLFGALALTLAPTLFSALFNYSVLNRTLDKWFNMPAHGIEMNLPELEKSYETEVQARIDAEALWISLLPQTRDALLTGQIDSRFFKSICEPRGIQQLILSPSDHVPLLLYQRFGPSKSKVLQTTAEVSADPNKHARLLLSANLTDDFSTREATIKTFMDAQKQLSGRRKFYRETYFMLICLLTLFVLFFASWSAQILSRQISVPISALLSASQEVRRGNLSYRIRVNAVDEMAALVRAFNEMTSELEGTSRELEMRRRFTEAILESIPTGFISLGSDERIERVNRALSGIFSQQTVEKARRLSDLFSGDDLADIRALLKSARRKGAAASQLELQRPNALLHLAVTAASLEETRGFVMVIEDTSDLLRAQKSAAWQEVARRIAHEIKNPLTPISLCADRIARQLLRSSLDPSSGLEPSARAILEECAQTIQQEVQTVKTLVDEFSQFSRFPSAQPAPADLNEIVRSAMAVFAGRLNDINVEISLDENLPLVVADSEQIKRVIVNLVDNAAEAMTDSPVRSLTIRTAHTSMDTAELSVIDTGIGVTAADKEKLFLPYFSTKGRGTGLGLAIVSHIVTEHQGRVRVEENSPRGARFIVELNTVAIPETITAPEPPISAPVTLKV